ncbi:MAG: ATP-binding protein [Thermomicrobiales bacterium]
MSLRLQYLAPSLALLACALAGWIVGWPLVGLAGGTVIALATGIMLSRHAVRRLADLSDMPSRTAALASPLLESSGSLDEIDSAYSSIVRWLAGERATIARERSQTDRQIRMLDRLSDGVLLVTDDGTVIYANVAAANLLGGRNPVGGSFIAAVRDHEASDSLFECLRFGTEARRNIEVPGEDRVVDAIFARVSGDPNEAVVVMRDVTELTKLQTLRRDFVANVSHELRTPLSTIKILTETIIDLSDEASEQMRFLEKIDAEVDSMSALVQDLLQLTQLESGRTPLSLSQVAVMDILNEVHDRMVPIAERSRVSLRILDGDPAFVLLVDERRIKQALINLVSNAIAHTRPGGKVEISFDSTGADVVFRVADSGVGISSADLDRIWERFYKVDRSRAHPGTGLGLAIVKHVAQAHDGSVAVTSEVGKGSTFEIRLPRRPLGPRPRRKIVR